MAKARRQLPTSYSGIYDSLTQSLSALNPSIPLLHRYASAIDIIGRAIRDLRATAIGQLKTPESEIAFFRDTWPQFYSLLFYYLSIYRYEQDRISFPSSSHTHLLKTQQRKIELFFRKQSEFYAYYTAKSPVLDAQFTRQTSRLSTYDDLALVIDPQFATLASYKAAWCLANQRYLDWLERQAATGTGESNTNEPVYEWKETKTAAVELIKAQALAGSIYIDGKPATAVRLKADFEAKYHCDLKDFNILLYETENRKLDHTPYLNKLINAFLGRKQRQRK